jgi:membrane-associated phospholipid phosphatase
MTALTSRQSSPRFRRTWTDAAWAAGALVVLALASLAALDRNVPGWEEAVFGAVNERSVLPFAVVWPVMQLGNVLTVVVGALAAAATRRFRLAVGLLGGGVLAYLLAKLVKDFVERPRPTGLVDVTVRGPAVLDNGFVSGHATVATVIVVLLLPYVSRRAGRVLLVLAGLVAIARVYVGAHLPLDVVGGAALAVAVASLVHLVLGRPGRSGPAAVRADDPDRSPGADRDR